MKFDAQRALTVYAGVLTAALTTLLITGAARPKAAPAQEIDVQRINIREPDGTLRMTISSAARSPGIIVKGREYPHPSRKSAGLLFFNDEGTENGGLIFGGKEVDGKVSSGGSLTFDRYHQDQVVQILGAEDGAQRRAGLYVNDQPEGRMDFAGMGAIGKLPPAQRDAAYAAANIGGKQRLFAGRAPDGSSQVALRDAAGRKRLIMTVTDAGAASIQFLDEGGKIVRSVTP